MELDILYMAYGNKFICVARLYHRALLEFLMTSPANLFPLYESVYYYCYSLDLIWVRYITYISFRPLYAFASNLVFIIRGFNYFIAPASVGPTTCNANEYFIPLSSLSLSTSLQIPTNPIKLSYPSNHSQVTHQDNPTPLARSPLQPSKLYKSQEVL